MGGCATRAGPPTPPWPSPSPPRTGPGRVACWWSRPGALLHPHVPQPAGNLLYELVTGHPRREPGELVVLADLAVELRAWPRDRWAARGVDLGQVAAAVVWRLAARRHPGPQGAPRARRGGPGAGP